MEYNLNPTPGLARGIVANTGALKAARGDVARANNMRTTPGREARRERRRAQRAQDKATRRSVQGGYSMAYAGMYFTHLLRTQEGAKK